MSLTPHIMILVLISTVIFGVLIGFLIRKKIVESRVESIEGLANKLIDEARKEAENIKKEAALQLKDSLYQTKTEFEREARDRRSELQHLERRLIQKEENMEKRASLLEQRETESAKKEKTLNQREETLQKQETTYSRLIEEQRAQIEKLSGITSAEAKNILMKFIEEEARGEAALLTKNIESEARETADKKSKEIIALAINRYAGDYVAEKTVSVVTLPSDEMKGRIIGREGRNIRAIEAATGVDLIIDDTPEAVIVSGFNPVRREVARLALERLIIDGRIHPARIEEIVQKVNQEMETWIKDAGEQAAFDVGIHGIHPELIKLLGSLKFRTSYAQNVLQHSLEVAFLCGIMASELRINIREAKRAGLFHDIGKAADYEIEGPHASIGAELARKYGESEKIVHAIAAHHEDVSPESVLAILVQAADTLSGARPGARKEMLEVYVKRLQDLERIANSFPGVSKSYAIQAGRELRVIVESNKISDADSFLLCKDIAKKIEKDLTYPGQVKVTVIRETRAVGYAK